MNKYYTPTIEEFHIGFEYEWLDENNNWNKSTPNIISKDNFEEQTYGLRVRYLDKKDIESLGFIYDKEKSNKKFWKFSGKNLMIGYKPKIKILTIFTQDPSKDNYFLQLNVDRFAVNNIKIKNKSELKVLLKQLNIEYE